MISCWVSFGQQWGSVSNTADKEKGSTFNRWREGGRDGGRKERKKEREKRKMNANVVKRESKNTDKEKA